MSAERLRQIEELYHAAREKGEAILAGADPELRREVERLLAQDSEGTKLLDQRAEDLVTAPGQMQLKAGFRLGPYIIEAPLGRGGMGQVFRAVDSRLGRSVAIKISQEGFGERFEREARAIAALNHPNVCTLHDVGPNYLVMELVEGKTLAERLKRGKLSIEQTIRIGSEIASALAAAHGKGIVHRDLKPANIMLTKSGVKVLDFGLAKSAIDTALTATNALIGTPAYMAPEQFEGKEADARTDIYALGLVLFEMLAGKQTPLQRLNAVPPALERVVQRCLEKDPDERWQSARDLRWALESSASRLAPVSSRPRTVLLPGAVGLLTLLLLALAFVHFREQSPPLEAVRMSVILPENSRPLSLAVSPDGRQIAVVLVKEGKQQVWVRALDALDPTPLAGTDGAADPFWSPDSRYIAFFADAKLKKVDRSGGPVETLCDALGVLGGTWSRDGDILLGSIGRVQRVSAAGGAVSDLAKDTGNRDTYPFLLPDGQHYLSTRVGNASSPQAGVWLNSLDGSAARRILPDTSNAQFVQPAPGSQLGAVLFTRAGTLMALPFDVKRLEAAGDAFAVAQQVAGANARWLASASRQGVLAYVSGQRGPRQYVWRDRQGKYLGVAGEGTNVVAISTDGKQLVGDYNGNRVLDLARGVSTQLSSGGGNTNPIWSSDGRYIAHAGRGGIYRRRADGAGAEELLVSSKTLVAPKSWSPDGRFLMYAQINPVTGADVMVLPLEGERKPFPLVQTQANEDQGQFSPDGQWVAYTSNESGLSEIYVIPFPSSPAGGKWMVSRGGGVQPRWRRDGKELLYISPESRMMAIEVSTQPVFHAGNPQALFLTEIVDTGIRTGPTSWDIAPDGRFLIITENAPQTSSLTVVLNWRAAIGK